MKGENLMRLQWQCRRGMLELDLLLSRFMATHHADLSELQLGAFRKLLDYPDQELLDLIMARAEPADSGVSTVLRLLRDS